MGQPGQAGKPFTCINIRSYLSSYLTFATNITLLAITSIAAKQSTLVRLDGGNSYRCREIGSHPPFAPLSSYPPFYPFREASPTSRCRASEWAHNLSLFQRPLMWLIREVWRERASAANSRIGGFWVLTSQVWRRWQGDGSALASVAIYKPVSRVTHGPQFHGCDQVYWLLLLLEFWQSFRPFKQPRVSICRVRVNLDVSISSRDLDYRA